MNWTLIISHLARKNLARFPRRDQERINVAFEEMRRDPLSGDSKRLKSHPVAFRRRVGSYRILFEIHFDEIRIHIINVERRSDTTYR